MGDLKELDDIIGKIVKEMKLEDLENKDLCYFCVALGVPIESSMHSKDILEGGPITSDKKCAHCYDTEEESGRLKLTKPENEYASYVLDKFKELKEKRINYILYPAKKKISKRKI